MKIAYLVARSDAVGGATIHIRDLASAMLARGHIVTFIVGGEGAVTEEFANKRIPYRSLKFLNRSIHPYRDLRAYFEVHRILEKLKPDLLSTHNAKAGVLGRIAARTLGIPVLFTVHGWTFTEGVPANRARTYLWAERAVAPLAHRIITVSEYDRQLALEYRVAPASKLITIRNGMPDITERYWASPASEPPRLIMVARFEEQKDHATLVRALAELKEQPWCLDFVGDGPLRHGIQTLTQQLGLAERVRFLGTHNDVINLLAHSQVFLLISNWEGFPRSILEAMRAGLPVITSDVGGSRESVEEGRTGFLIPRGDVNTLQDRLRQLIASPKLRLQMGIIGRKRYEANFTFKHMFEKTLNVYYEILQR